MSDDDLTTIGRRIGYGDTAADLFGVSRADRRRHIYVQGKTGSGKSTLLLSMLMQDLERGEGVCLIDPLGHTAEAVLERVPGARTNQVRYFNVADLECPLGLNILSGHDPARRHRAVAAVVDVFASVWGLSLERTPQLLAILGYGVAALMELPGATLLHLPRFLTDDGYRTRALAKVTDPGVRAYWLGDFGTRGKRERREACGSVLNKVQELRRDPLMRNIFGQETSAIDAPFLLQNRGILIVNLAKGEVGGENARLIGACIVSLLTLAAAARAPLIKRREEEDSEAALAAFPDFYAYLDEFHDYATAGFDATLSQGRNGRLSLACFHQYQAQLPEPVRRAVFGNVGSIVAFGVGAEDAAALSNQFDRDISAEELTGLRQHEIAVRLPPALGNPPVPFRAFTLPLQAPSHGVRRRGTVIAQSRMRYGRDRARVERAVARILAPGIPAARPRSATRPRAGRAPTARARS